MTVYLKDYRAPDYTISHIDLKFELDEEVTIVNSNLFIKKQDLSSQNPLVLNGGNFELLAIRLNDEVLKKSDYTIANNQLTLHKPPSEPFTLNIINKINPKTNTSLEGLYKTGDILTTQCESQGFRNITFFLDRTDVLATYTTEIHANKIKYPVLLANGNLKFSGDHPSDSTKHICIYDDPIPKPSYLFAMVGGQLGLNEDHFITMSGRKITLRIFVPEGQLSKTTHAMTALKAAMHFDEDNYDREYDLDIYNIVGVPQFNAGAMENKGLNVFNDSYLLVDKESATDNEFELINTVVGHEYFHNWRGNRVTVKQWFELSLKEGFATITEQEFSQKLYQSLVSRISDVRRLQTEQFVRDAGPLAQAVRPAEYESTDNLYTSTIYYKGAELLNMLKYMLGEATFRKACNFYFAKNDGKAVDIEALLAAMSEASGKDLSQFLIWYEQEGTPELYFDADYNAEAKTYTLRVRQSCPATPNQQQKKSLPIPIAIALLSSVTGEEMQLQLQGETLPPAKTRVLELNKEMDTFTFVNVAEKPVPSLMRNFSAPVKVITSPVNNEDLKFLLKYDTDPINRWFAGYNLAKNAIINIIEDLKAGNDSTIDLDLIEAYRAVLMNPTIEPRLVTEILSFPPVNIFFEYVKPINPDLIKEAHNIFLNCFAYECYDQLKTTYLTYAELPTSDTYRPEDAGLRSLKNLCLAYLLRNHTFQAYDFCFKQLQSATNMTDTLGALAPMVIYPSYGQAYWRDTAINKFIQKWKDNPVAIKHLFSMYAKSEVRGTLDRIIEVMQSDYFKKANPDHVQWLLVQFYMKNPCVFHEASGRAYKFFADTIIELDKINPSTAKRLVPAFECWEKMEPVRQAKMLEQLMRLHALPLRPEDASQQVPGVDYISRNVKELVDKNVKNAIVAKPSVGSLSMFAKDDKANEEAQEQKQAVGLN